MKRSDLITVCVSGDEGLSGVSIVDCSNAATADTQPVEPFNIGFAVLTDGGHDQRIAIEQFEVVGDIAGAATKLAPDAGHQKGDIDFM